MAKRLLLLYSTLGGVSGVRMPGGIAAALNGPVIGPTGAATISGAGAGILPGTGAGLMPGAGTGMTPGAAAAVMAPGAGAGIASITGAGLAPMAGAGVPTATGAGIASRAGSGIETGSGTAGIRIPNLGNIDNGIGIEISQRASYFTGAEKHEGLDNPLSMRTPVTERIGAGMGVVGGQLRNTLEEKHMETNCK